MDSSGHKRPVQSMDPMSHSDKRLRSSANPFEDPNLNSQPPKELGPGWDGSGLMHGSNPAACVPSLQRHLAQPGNERLVLTWTSKQLKGSEANYGLYFLVPNGDGARARICVVGIDSRKSGHYTYNGTLPDAPPLNATNQAAVRAWMVESFGHMDSSTREAVHALPEYTEDEIRAMVGERLSARGNSSARSTQSKMRGPVSRKEPTPALWQNEFGRSSGLATDVMSGWTDVEEIKERHPDGRKRILFILKDATNPTRQLTVITADESRPSDRRYSYKASPELGGYSFKNRTLAVEWIQRYFLSSMHPDGPVFASPRGSGATTSSQQAPSGGYYLAPGDLSEVEAAFNFDIPLLHWAIEPVNQQQLQQYKVWAVQLAAHNCIQPVQPRDMPAFEEQPEKCREGMPTWTSTEKAIFILSRLLSTEVSLQLLEQSRVCRAVATLRNHSDQDLSSLAVQLATEWRGKAQRSLELATAALQSNTEDERQFHG